MRMLLMLFPVVMMLQEGLNYSIDFGSRLSGKNIIILLALVLIVARMSREGRYKIDLPIIQVCFIVLVAYSIGTWFVASFIVSYAMYPVWANFVFLKLLMLDRFLVFLAFFYGPRTESDVLWLLKALLLVVVFAQVVTVGESLNILPTNFVGVRSTGRVFGLIGESNQFALFTVLFLPALLAFAASSRGIMRLVWFVGALLSAASFAMTMSRGATFGAFASLAVGLFVFRNQISPARAMRWAAFGIAAVVIGIGLVWSQYGDMIYERMVTDTLRQQTVSGASMGRTEIWVAALDRMIQYPVTLITGFGWRAYWSLPQAVSPHNTYLEYWFNLGLPGLVSLVAIFAVGATVAHRASNVAGTMARPHLVAFVFGLLAVMAGLTFTEWYEPWSYFWPYFGLVMRLAVVSRETAAISVPVAEHLGSVNSGPGGTAARDAFGWSRQ